MPTGPAGRPLIVALAAALLSAALLLGVLLWHVMALRTIITQKLSAAPEEPTMPVIAPLPLTVLPSRDAALLHLRQGDLFALQGRWKDAEAAYRLAVREDGGLTALRKLAQAQLQRRDFRSVRFTIEQLKRTGARSEDLLLLEGITLLRTGELTKAEALLREEEDSPQKFYLLSLLAIMEDDHEQAKQALERTAAGWDPSLRQSAKTLLAAYDEYTRFPESPVAHLMTLLARALAQVQECEVALPLLSQVTSTEPDYRDAWTVQGFCELTTERFEEALTSFERAYAIDPEKPEIQYFLARALSAQGRAEQAITFFEYALRNGFVPTEEVRQALAEEALTTGNLGVALEQQEALTKLPSATVETFAALVDTLRKSSREEEAYLKAKEAAERWPDEATAHELLGRAALATKRTEEAKAALGRALELDPERASTRKLLDEIGL